MRLQRKLLRKCSHSGIRKQVLLSTNKGLKNRKRRSGEDSQFSYGSVIAATFHGVWVLCSDLGLEKERGGRGESWALIRSCLRTRTGCENCRRSGIKGQMKFNTCNCNMRYSVGGERVLDSHGLCTEHCWSRAGSCV